jgi:hypothetical protein
VSDMCSKWRDWVVHIEGLGLADVKEGRGVNGCRSAGCHWQCMLSLRLVFSMLTRFQHTDWQVGKDKRGMGVTENPSPKT